MTFQSVLALMLVVPWLVPMGPAPSPTVLPWLLSLSCAVLLWLAREKLDASQIRNGWIAAACLSAVIGLLQYAGVSQIFAPWVSPSMAGEALGNLRQRNHLATLMNIGGVSLLHAAVATGASSRARQAAIFGCVLMVGLGNAASSSRTGLVGLLLIGVLVVIWGGEGRHRRLRVFALLALAYAVAVGLLPWLLMGDAGGGFFARFQQTVPACSGRLTLWANMLELITRHPWLGWGWGDLDYAHLIMEYRGVRNCEQIDNAHNLLLHLAVELGVPAAILFCATVLRWIWRAKPWKESNPDRQLAWSVIGLIVLHSMLEYPLWFGPFQMAMGLCLWLLSRRDVSSKELAVWRCERMMERLLSAVVLVSAAYAAWDYHRISQIYLPPEQRAPAYRENTLEKIRGSWLFSDQVRYAEYTLTPLTRNNAEQLYAMGLLLLHYSPEVSVVEKLIESAVLLGRDEEARFYLARYKAAYPQEQARWAARQREPDAAQ